MTPEVQRPEWIGNVLLGYEQEPLKDLKLYVGAPAKSKLLSEIADNMLEVGIKFNTRIKQLRQYAGVLNVTPEEKILPSVKTVLRRVECGLKR